MESALAQTYKPLEIIVVNDGSERETEQLYPYDGDIRVLNQKNGGTASALNAGFRYATGHYIAWLSSDDRFHPNKIERQVQYMQETGYSIGHTSFYRMDSEGIVESHPIALHEGPMVNFYRTLLTSNRVNGCTVMMTKSLFTRMGGFNEQFPYTHDYDLWIRTILSGFPMGYLNEPLTDYRVHAAMGTLRHDKAIQQEISSIRRTYTPRLEQLLTALQHGQVR
ncbi:glycosyl transferase family 2 [Cohnella abietis]|uniref:Glycosyl transferase family 2 n=1 Tax=Cohnella abietis TaxID=2507935 RepID=A0A3T1DA88_9BACL|nr:glycosyl transferase family 2 [Cohnella abietis]